MGINLRVLIESYPMNTNMIGFRWCSNILCPCALEGSSFSIGRVKGALIPEIHGILYERKYTF